MFTVNGARDSVNKQTFQVECEIFNLKSFIIYTVCTVAQKSTSVVHRSLLIAHEFLWAVILY